MRDNIAKLPEECTLTDKELADKVSEGITRLAKTGGKSFVMHVPARVNEDLDLIVSELVRRFRVFMEGNPSKEQDNEHLKSFIAELQDYKEDRKDLIDNFIPSSGAEYDKWMQDYIALNRVIEMLECD